MTTGEIISIVAIVVGPLFAVLITYFMQNYREGRRIKQSLFETLVSYRGVIPISGEWVAALNRIDIIFHRNKKITASWKKYFDSLHTENTLQARNILLADLLDDISRYLGYKNIKQTIFLDSYVPQQFANSLTENQRLNDLYIELTRVLRNSDSFGGNPPQDVRQGEIIPG